MKTSSSEACLILQSKHNASLGNSVRSYCKIKGKESVRDTQLSGRALAYYKHEVPSQHDSVYKEKHSSIRKKRKLREKDASLTLKSLSMGLGRLLVILADRPEISAQNSWEKSGTVAQAWHQHRDTGQEDLWSSLANRASSIRELRFCEKLCLKKVGVGAT